MLHWTGASWARIRLPVFPLPFGDYATYGDLTAADAKDAWMVISIYDSSHALVGTIPAYWTGTTWQLMSSTADILGSMAPDGGRGYGPTASTSTPAASGSFITLPAATE